MKLVRKFRNDKRQGVDVTSNISSRRQVIIKPSADLLSNSGSFSTSVTSETLPQQR